MLPIFLILKDLSLQFRIISVICTFATAIGLILSTPKLLASLHIERSSVNSKAKFEIIIDSNYDGTQIEPYLQKPDSEGN